MKISIIIKSVAILFVIITSILLSLLVLDVASSQEVRDAIYKIAGICGIIAVASTLIMFLSDKK